MLGESPVLVDAMTHLIRATSRWCRGLAMLMTMATVDCSSSTATAPTTGTLTVAVAAPTGVTPTITINGPGGFMKAINETTTLSGLATGQYSIVAAPVSLPGLTVGSIIAGTVSGSPVDLTAGMAAKASVGYAPRPGSGGFWIAQSYYANPTVTRYSAAQLDSSTSAPAATTVAIDSCCPSGIAFDSAGNVWLALQSSNEVAEYRADQLGASGDPAAAVILSEPAGTNPLAVAFDPSGNLWVSNSVASTVVEFAHSQLRVSGSPTPAVTIGAVNGSLAYPEGLAFDRAGNLWVANWDSGTVVSFAPSQRLTSGTPTPAVTLSAVNNSIGLPIGLAFDAQGNLWVSNQSNSSVVEFSAADLISTGAPNPAVLLQGPIAAPRGLAFDDSGNLWLAGYPSVVEFPASQLRGSGTPIAQVTLSGASASNAAGVAFDPPPGNLPLYASGVAARARYTPGKPR
jgi:sugar lactone lactonase YvrE